MSDPQLNAPTGTGTVRQSLIGAVAFPGDAFCEAFSATATPREHWQSLLAALDATGFDVLRKRQERVRSMRHEDGATYNLFDDATSRGTSWALDMIPLPMAAGEWEALEAGLIQRAQLLERILADVYGPQELLKTGRIPPELLFANPNFLRSCHGIHPSGNRYLTYYAADLYRAPDGRFRVFRDYGDNPAGIGYALENRIVLSRVFSRLYHGTQVRRLAPFFNTFYHSLLQRASLRLEDPGIVLLSPGPESQVYFEQALLSRYLGLPLVEGQDLTVRNGEVFLKKLAGLEPVAAIWRHVDDAG
ncbi:MAG: circularly permuted type 2 ATP-grasp protein, partial [Candidatus Thiodiazotropha sp.]